MKRFALGFLCLVIYAIFSPHYPDSYYLTDEYEVRTAMAFPIITIETKKRFLFLFVFFNVLIAKRFAFHRRSHSGIAVCSFSCGAKSFCINMSAVGL